MITTTSNIITTSIIITSASRPWMALLHEISQTLSEGVAQSSAATARVYICISTLYLYIHISVYVHTYAAYMVAIFDTT